MRTAVRLLSCYGALMCSMGMIDVRAEEDVVFACISVPREPSLPDSWKGGIVQGSLTALPLETKDRAERITKDLLKRYPGRVLTRTVRKIYLVGDMSLYGQGACGTYAEDELYIAAGSILRKFDDTTLRKTLHHEISSLMKGSFAEYFPSDAWAACNPKGFEYQKSRAPRNDTGTTIDRKLSETGFLCQYSQHSLEDDFNMMAENMFEPSEQFYEAVEHCEAIRAKCRLAVRFYLAVDPAFKDMIPWRLRFLVREF